MEETLKNHASGLERLRKQYLCCTPLNKFEWPDSIDKFEDSLQRHVLNLTINNELLIKYPIKHSYKRAFLKQFIDKLEQNEIDIDDAVYNTYCALLASTDENAPMHYRHFLIRNENVLNLITIKESTSIISEGTTGLCSWKAALHLAEWCIFNHEKIQNKRILELGSGVGLTGLAMLNYCRPKSYHFSDAHPVVLKTLEENVRLNLYDKHYRALSDQIFRFSNERSKIFQFNHDTEVRTLKLEWEKIDESFVKKHDFDLVIAADVLYDSTLFEPLAMGLKQLLRDTVVCAILAATVRNESTISEFLMILDKHDLAHEEETSSMPQLFIQHEETPVRIFKILRRNK